MKSKVTKKRNNLSVQKIKNVKWIGNNLVPRFLQKISPNIGTCVVLYYFKGVVRNVL